MACWLGKLAYHRLVKSTALQSEEKTARTSLIASVAEKENEQIMVRMKPLIYAPRSDAFPLSQVGRSHFITLNLRAASSSHDRYCIPEQTRAGDRALISFARLIISDILGVCDCGTYCVLYLVLSKR